jgi:hypothetical protein
MAGMRSSHGVLLAHLVGTGERRCATAQRDELASPHGLPSVRGITPYHLVCKNAPLCITAKLVVEWQGWVIRDRTGRRGATVYVRSAPKADMIYTGAECSEVPKPEVAIALFNHLIGERE